MAGRIPQSFIDDLLDRVDIVDVISHRVKLKRTGKNYSALCPFHNEKSPSFSVNPQKQFYYCFGCGAAGNSLKFLLEHDRLEFPEAIEELARLAGVEVPREHNPQADQQRQQRKTLQGVLDIAAEFYRTQLRAHARGDHAVRYLKGRGLSGQIAQHFGLGYAPPGWDNLMTAAGAQDPAQLKRLIDAGMVIEKEDGKVYDRFRDRIMFPIRNQRGQVIGFGGRVLTDEKPKYLNSPETDLYQKRKELYGLYEALHAPQKPERFLVVEGYMDVISLHQFGVPYGVATLGTATSEEHLHKMFKVVNEVIFCFDGDNAGRQAAVRALEVALSEAKDGRTMRFLFLPDGEDPDTLIRKEGVVEFEQRLSQSPSLGEFILQHWQDQVDMTSVEGKARLVHIALPDLHRLPEDGTLRAMIIRRLADIAELPHDVIQQQLDHYTALQAAKHSNKTGSQQTARNPDRNNKPGQPVMAPLQPQSSPDDVPDWMRDGPPPLQDHAAPNQTEPYGPSDDITPPDFGQETFSRRQYRAPTPVDLQQTRQPPPWQKAMALMLCWPTLVTHIDLGTRRFKAGDHTAWVESMLTLLQQHSAENRYAAHDLLAPHGFDDILQALSRTEYFAILTQYPQPQAFHRDILQALMLDLTHQASEHEEYQQLRTLWVSDHRLMTREQKERYLELLKSSKNGTIKEPERRTESP
ncbi:DNA primase [Salinispirillum marinum]|uniref:DNA primase n=2 Tax=Saccharospirillaceae TaxID=255527 RepID=A0ABV8BBN4_9GAMM